MSDRQSKASVMLMDTLKDGRTMHVFIPSHFDEIPLTLEAFRVYCHLVRRADRDGKCFPSLAKIGEHCFRGSYPNSSAASLKAKAVAAVKELCSYGLIRKELVEQEGGYNHNNYYLTDAAEWKIPDTDISTCNVRKGRAGLSRGKKSVNQDNPVNPENSVNGSDKTRLTGITASVNPTPPKGISIEGISIEGISNRSSGYAAVAGDAGASPSDRAVEDEENEISNRKRKRTPTAASKGTDSVKKHDGSEKTDSGRKKSHKRKPPAVSQYHPEECRRLYDLWTPMFVEYRGALDSLQQFVQGFDLLLEEGMPLEQIVQGVEYYVSTKMAYARAGRKNDTTKPPDAIRFFRGKENSESYCLLAYNLWLMRKSDKVEPIAPTPPGKQNIYDQTRRVLAKYGVQQ